MCESILLRLLDDDNAVEMLQYAEHFNLRRIRQGCDLYLLRRWNALEGSGRLLGLDPAARARFERSLSFSRGLVNPYGGVPSMPLVAAQGEEEEEEAGAASGGVSGGGGGGGGGT